MKITATKLPRVHPGQVIREEFLEPLGITAYRLAKSIGVPQSRITAILAGKRGITADTALRLSRYFGTTPEVWINLQATYELQQARSKGLSEVLEKIKPFPMPTREGLVEEADV